MREIIALGCQPSELWSILHRFSISKKLSWHLAITQPDLLKITLDEDMEAHVLILNIDTHAHVDLSPYQGYEIITIGYNPRASITVSSVEEDELVICIQREIKSNDRCLEPQECVIREQQYVFDIINNMFAFAIEVLVGCIDNSTLMYKREIS